MSCVNPNDPLFKILLKEIKNPLLAEIEFDRQEGVESEVEVEEEVVGDVDRNDELDSYITDQLFTKLGITVPNKNNETLIPQGDVDKFNRYDFDEPFINKGNYDDDLNEWRNIILRKIAVDVVGGKNRNNIIKRKK